MNDLYFTREQTIRENYKIDIEIFYHDIQYSYKQGKKSYGTIQNYAKDYIRVVKKMYLAVRDPNIEYMTMFEMVSLMNSFEKRNNLTKQDELFKDSLHKTLIARRLLEEAIRFVGGGSFEKIRRRINDKRNKAKNERNASRRI